MRELNTAEISEVSGSYGNGIFADAFEAARCAVVGAATGTIFGAIIGGKHGGDGGGQLGFGIIGQGVGMLAGGAIGFVAAGALVTALGWDKGMTVVNDFYKGYTSGNYNP